MKRPLILGHRGARGLAPENTLAAFTAGLEAGADGFEFDVQRTKDGHLVVFHDGNLQRVVGISGKIVTSNLAQLKELEAGQHFDGRFAGEPIPTLEQVLDHVPQDCFLNIEAKRFDFGSDGLERALADVVRQRDLYDRVVVSSFNPVLLWRLGRMDRRIPLGLIYEPGPVFGRGDGWTKRFLRLAALHPFHEAVTAELVADVHSRGWRLNTWTVNEPEEMWRLIDLGVDGIITDHPDVAVSLLAEMDAEVQLPGTD